MQTVIIISTISKMVEIKTLLIVLAALIVLMIIAWVLTPSSKSGFEGGANISKKEHHKCTTSCSGIDPVSEPEYNMKQIAMQSILLEEHITQKEKRCRDCIAKHFLHMQGLHSEALWLAGDHAKEYPYLVDTIGFYSGLFDEWLNHQNDEAVLLDISSKLREMRKKIVAKYYFQEDNVENH
jgi:hypothetical protein